MDKMNWINARHSSARESVGNIPRLLNEPSDDQLGDEVFGVPPSLLTGLLTGLAGTVVGGVSLPIYFFLRNPYYYISPEWLIFVALGGIVGIFLRLEQPFFREIYCLKTTAFEQSQATGECMDMQFSLGFKVGLDR